MEKEYILVKQGQAYIFNTFEGDEIFWYSELGRGHSNSRGYRKIEKSVFGALLRKTRGYQEPLNWNIHLKLSEITEGFTLNKKYKLEDTIQMHNLDEFNQTDRIVSVIRVNEDAS